MSRRYHLDHLSIKSEADRILQEIRKLDGVKNISITEDLREMDIDVEEECITAVMDRVVNVCRKVSYGCEIRYKFT